MAKITSKTRLQGTTPEDDIKPASETKQDDIVSAIETIAGLEIPAHDYVGMSYTGTNMTGVVYKTGGAGGTTVATLVLGYDGSDQLTSVTKS